MSMPYRGHCEHLREGWCIACIAPRWTPSDDRTAKPLDAYSGSAEQRKNCYGSQKTVTDDWPQNACDLRLVRSIAWFSLSGTMLLETT